MSAQIIPMRSESAFWSAMFDDISATLRSHRWQGPTISVSAERQLECWAGESLGEFGAAVFDESMERMAA